MIPDTDTVYKYCGKYDYAKYENNYIKISTCFVIENFLSRM